MIIFILSNQRYNQMLFYLLESNCQFVNGLIQSLIQLNQYNQFDNQNNKMSKYQFGIGSTEQLQGTHTAVQHHQFSSGSGLSCVPGGGSLRNDRNSNSLVGRQSQLVGSHSMNGVLSQAALNCELARPGTALMLSSSNLPMQNILQGSSLSNKVSSHKKTMTAINMNLEKSSYLSHNLHQHQQNNLTFEAGKNLWQNDHGSGAGMAPNIAHPLLQLSKEDVGKPYQLAISAVSQATSAHTVSACSVGGKHQHFIQLRKQEAAKSDTKCCLHVELISYKVHKDQFKSLLIPLMKHQKKVVNIKGSSSGNRNRRNKTAKTFDHGKHEAQADARGVLEEINGNGRASSRNQKSRACAITLKKASNAGPVHGAADGAKNLNEASSEEDQRFDNLLAAQANDDTDESGEECLSTDGEESDPDSPLYPDNQYLNQSNDLRAALINSKALVGDYVELKNCKRCGSMIFKDQSSAIKPEAEEFNADISPAQLLTKMFQDEAKYKFDHYIRNQDVNLTKNKVAKAYIEQRSKLVTRIMDMGKKFKQREKTLHIAIELVDRYFLDRKSQADKDVQSMSPRVVTVFVTTCFLIASKYDEIDDRLVFINDVQSYYKRIPGGPATIGGAPTYTDIVECERLLLKFFEWDLGFVMPIHFIEMFLANGVLFESEYNKNISKTKQTAKKISARCYEILDEMVRQKDCFKNQGFSGNQVASMVVYTARQEVLNLTRARHIWPKELQLISRQTDKQVKKLARKYRAANRIHRIEPFEDNAAAIQKMNHGILTDQSKQLYKMNDPSLVSPKASVAVRDHLISSEKISVDIPVAQIVIPAARKRTGAADGRKTIDQTSQSKSNISEYKMGAANRELQDLKLSLEPARTAPFSTKKMSLERVGLNSSSQIQKLHKLPASGQKKLQPYMSTQKSDDRRQKPFADRRISQNNSRQLRSINENPLSSGQFRLTRQSEGSASSTMPPSGHTFKSGQKGGHSKATSHLAVSGTQSGAPKSQRSFLNAAAARQTANSSTVNSGQGPCSSRKSSRAPFESRAGHQSTSAYRQGDGLRITSARQDIIGHAANRGTTATGRQAKVHDENQPPEAQSRVSHLSSSGLLAHAHQYRTKLQSKYGQSAQQNGSSSIIASASSTTSAGAGSRLYQSSLSLSKVTGSNNTLGPSAVSSYWKRNEATSGSRACSGALTRPHSSAVDTYNSTTKSKYQNPYVYRRTSASKDGLRSVTSAGTLSQSKTCKAQGPGIGGHGGTRSRPGGPSRNKDTRTLRPRLTTGGRMDTESGSVEHVLQEEGSRTRLRQTKPYEAGRVAGDIAGARASCATSSLSLLKGQREGSVGAQLRARDRAGSSALAGSTLRHTIHTIKPPTRHTMVFRTRDTRDKSVSTTGDHRLPSHGASQSALKKLKDIREATTVAEVRQIMQDVKARYRDSSGSVVTKQHTENSEKGLNDLSKPNTTLDRVAAMRSAHNHSAISYAKTRI